MTNRTKSGKRGKGLRYLDLSFEGSEKPAPTREGPVHKPLSVSTNSSFRPHAGHRAKNKSKGIKKHPPNQFSFNKSVDYQKQLQEDIDRLFQEEFLERSGSPSWVHQVANEVRHSEESPLFNSKYIAANKADQQNGFTLHEREMSPRPSSGGNQYYRPNRTHQYLTATELTDQSEDVKLGRPTRTTLLRARQKGTSSPKNSYDSRREKHKKEEERAELRKAMASQMNVFLQELLSMCVPEGESLHSFITGSRYNRLLFLWRKAQFLSRAHYMDSKVLMELGIYMPRNNPQGCFVVSDSRSSSTDPPPGTPESALTEETASTVSDQSPPQSPSPRPEPYGDVDKEHSLGESTDDDARQIGIQIIEEVLDLEEGNLKVKGVGYGGNRSRSARSIRGQQSMVEHRPASVPRRGLPAVQIQGTSFSRISAPKPHADGQQLLEVTNSSTHGPHSPIPIRGPHSPAQGIHSPLGGARSPVAPLSPAPPTRRGPITVKDISQKLAFEDTSKKGAVPQLPHISQQEKPNVMEEMPGNVDTIHTVGSDPRGSDHCNLEIKKAVINQPTVMNQPEAKENKPQIPDTESRVEPAGEKEGLPEEAMQPIIKKDRAASAKGSKKARVRFADEQGQGEPKDDNVKFFITENGDTNSAPENIGRSERVKKEDKYDSGIESDAGTDSRDIITSGNEDEQVQVTDDAESVSENAEIKDKGDIELASINSDDTTSEPGIISVDITAKPSIT